MFLLKGCILPTKKHTLTHSTHPFLHCASQIEYEVSLSQQMKDGKKLVLGDQCLGDIASAGPFFPASLLPLILSEMVCASSNLHNTLLTPLL